MCRFIPGDANLYSMFRVDGAAVDCPFHGPLAFAYDRGKGECAWPHSQMESCNFGLRVIDPNAPVWAPLTPCSPHPL